MEIWIKVLASIWSFAASFALLTVAYRYSMNVLFANEHVKMVKHIPYVAGFIGCTGALIAAHILSPVSLLVAFILWGPGIVVATYVSIKEQEKQDNNG